MLLQNTSDASMPRSSERVAHIVICNSALNGGSFHRCIIENFPFKKTPNKRIISNHVVPKCTTGLDIF